MRQVALFGELDEPRRGPVDDTTKAERKREQNRLRQLAFRRRNQFCAPCTESPTWTSTERRLSD
jgi:hypothetical protein